MRISPSSTSGCTNLCVTRDGTTSRARSSYASTWSPTSMSSIGFDEPSARLTRVPGTKQASPAPSQQPPHPPPQPPPPLSRDFHILSRMSLRPSHGLKPPGLKLPLPLPLEDGLLDPPPVG